MYATLSSKQSIEPFQGQKYWEVTGLSGATTFLN